MHLIKLQMKPASRDLDRFPFSLPVIRSIGEIAFTGPVTFFAGENGTGKSTLLEAIAVAADLPTIGGVECARDPSLVDARNLSRQMRLTWRSRTRRGLFMRAEDFRAFVRKVQQERQELAQLEAEYTESFSGYARQLTVGATKNQRMELERRYGADLDANSHGECFLKVMQARRVPRALYLLDEPETPLSPQRQLALIALMMDMVRADCQFVVATHSPIVMAFPDAQILSFDGGTIHPVAYEELDHVTFTREFLDAPERFLRHL